jgi:hypothetical protein
VRDNRCKNFNQTTLRKRPLGKNRWENNTKVDIKETRFEDVDCINLA